MSTHRAGGVAALVASVAGLLWFATELAAPLLGYADTDSADVMLPFLAEHPWVYATGGIALLTVAAALIPAFLAIGRVIDAGRGGLAARCSAVVGCIAAAFLALQGVLRLGGGPLLHIAELDPQLGRAGYTAVQLLGVQGAMQLGVLALCSWAVLVGIVGGRRRTLPRWIAWLAVIPAARLVLLLIGPFAGDDLPGALWLVAIASIPLTWVWCGLVGAAMLRGGRTP